MPAVDDIPNIPGQGSLTRKGAAWLKRVDALDKAGVKPPRGGASDAWRKATGLDDDAAESDRAARPLRRTSKDREPGRAGLASRALGEDDELVILDDGQTVRARGIPSRDPRARTRSAGGLSSVGDDDGVTLEAEVRDELARAVSRPRAATSEKPGCPTPPGPSGASASPTRPGS